MLKAARDPAAPDHHLPLLRWAHHSGIVSNGLHEWFDTTVGESGNAELVTEVLAGATGFSPSRTQRLQALLCGAAAAGHDELARQLLVDLTELDDHIGSGYDVKDSVAAGGCVRTAAAIDDDPAAWRRFLPHALRNGRLRFAEWVLADGDTDDYTLLLSAAKSGSVELVAWLHSKGCAVRGGALTNAAASGNLDLCKWVVERGLVPTQDDMEAAVKGGHVEVLEWLRSQGCTCTSRVLRLAVRKAGVPVVSWCLDHHPDPSDAGDLLALSCQNEQGNDMFEYLADERGLRSSPTALMRAAAQVDAEHLRADPFDAAILVKRYGSARAPLYPGYILDAIRREHLGRLRFALGQAQDVSDDCFRALVKTPDAALLQTVLLAWKGGGRLSEADQAHILSCIRDHSIHLNAIAVLKDHSMVISLAEHSRWIFDRIRSIQRSQEAS